MKKFNAISCLIFIVLSSSKCKEETARPLPNPNPWGYATPALDTLWTTPLGFGITPKFTNNKDVLMSSRYTTAQGEVFKLFDANTGKLKWEWADYFKVEENFANEKHIAINDALILCGRNATYALNMLTGQTLWKHQIDSLSGEPRIFNDEDGYIYHGFSSKTENSTYYIFRTKYTEPNWELVCTFKDTLPVDRVSATSIACSKNAKGEKIMVFTLYMDYTLNGNLKTVSKVCGYNINTQQYDWIKDYSSQWGELNVCKMQSSNGKVFTFASKGPNGLLIAFDVNNGNIAWKQELPEYGTYLMLYKNSIVITSDYGSLTNKSFAISFEQSSGAKEWESILITEGIMGKPNYQFGFDACNVFKNYLFSTHCSNLVVLNLDNGTIVFNKPVSLPQGCLQYGVAINEQKRCFYVQDRNKAICYKLPEEVKY